MDKLKERAKTGDDTLDWMIENLPSSEVTLQRYVELNWLGERTLEDLDGEELAELPEELYPEPPSKSVN